MIVITYLNTKVRYVSPGDVFKLTVSDCCSTKVIIEEKIITKEKINFIASFRFALEDGTCPGFHLTGVFANKEKLPIELKNAKFFEDLTLQQQQNFRKSVGTKM